MAQKWPKQKRLEFGPKLVPKKGIKQVSKKGLITKSIKAQKGPKNTWLEYCFFFKSPKKKFQGKKTKGPTSPNSRHKKPTTDQN